MFTIDRDMCIGDGACAAECPAKIIEMSAEDNIPVPVEGFEEFCINCGHCVAVCSQGAFSLKGMEPGDCKTIREGDAITPKQAEIFLTSRRSIRAYKKQPVSRDVLAKLIDIARFAPSGHNSQPVGWLIIEESFEVQRLAGLVADWMRLVIKETPQVAVPLHFDKVVAAWDEGKDRICRGAPHLIMAHAPASLVTSQAACTIAQTYLELAAFSLGLGACWAGYLGAAAGSYSPLKKALALPEGHKCFSAMLVGHPEYNYHRIPLRKNPAVIWR